MDGDSERNARTDTATRIGRYKIVERIGQGATAAVYRATDEVAGRDVALKLLLTDLEGEGEIRSRFLREVEIARLLRHRNLVTVYEAGEIDGRFFLAMELLEGVTLREHLVQHPALDLEDKLDLMMQLCEGLAVAHDHGIYHRDLKPSNLFVRDDGALKILDFGIARLASSSMTVAGLLMGTPDFMSPEQARGGEIDHRSDIFSAGAVLYFLLSGRKPFPGAQLPNVLHKVEHEEPVALVDAEAPAGLARVVSKALAKQPAARHSHVRLLLRDLVEFRRDYAKATRGLAARAREQGEEARTLDERYRTLAGALQLPDVDATQDVLVSAGVAARYPDVAEGGAALLAWIPMRHGQAKDIADSLGAFSAARRELVGRLTGAVESLQAAGEAASKGDPSRAIENAERTLAAFPASAAAVRIADAAREDSAARNAQARHARAAEALAQARRALVQGDWTAAEGHLARARGLDAQLPDLAAVRQELQSRRTAADAARSEDERQRTLQVAAGVATAEDALKRGDFDAAARAAASVLARAPGEARAERVRAEAAASGRAASERSAVASQLTAHLGRGRALVEAGRFDEARGEAQRALALDAGHAGARQLAADALRGAVDERRKRDAPRIAERCTKASRMFFAHADRALLVGDLERARGVAETALAIDPHNQPARRVLARALQAIDELGDGGSPGDRADPDATQIVRLPPDSWSRFRARLAAIVKPRRRAARNNGPALVPLDACRLRIARASGAARHLDLAPRRYRVGRGRENEIVLDDPSHTVSRLHAELEPGSGGFVLVDHDSDNGLWVDGERVQRVTLEPNVPVVIGPYRLVLEGSGAAGDAEPASKRGGARP